MENDANLVSPVHGVSKIASAFEERMHSPTEEAPLSPGPRRRASSVYSPKTLGPRPRASPKPLHLRLGHEAPRATIQSPVIQPSPLAKIVPGYEETGVQTDVPENANIAIQATVLAGTDAGAQSNLFENRNAGTQMHGPESLNADTQTNVFATTAKATQTEPFSPSIKTLFALGQSALERLKRPSWPLYERNKDNNEKAIINETDLDDDTSTIVEDELPVRLFGTGEFSDPILRALQLQDGVDAIRVDGEIPIQERRDAGLSLSRATAHWLREHEPGQRRWSSEEMDRPCAVCHATREDAARSVLDHNLGFCSSLNLKYNDSEQYAWSFGQRYVVVEKQCWRLRPNQLPAEVWASWLLRKHTKVPTPRVVAAWKEGHVAITMTERVRGGGRPLAELWTTYSDVRRQSVAKQVARCVRQWRRITSPAMSALDKGPCLWVDDAGSGGDGEENIIYSDADYRDFVRRRLIARGWDELTARMTVDLMHTSTPFVFTHGNLTLDNIFVHEGRVVAITGLGRAAYLPAWAESLAIHNAYGKAEREWKEILFKYIGSEGVRRWYNIYEELLEETNAEIKREKTGAIQHKLGGMISEKIVRDAAAARIKRAAFKLKSKKADSSKDDQADPKPVERTTKGKESEGMEDSGKETTLQEKRRSKRLPNIIIGGDISSLRPLHLNAGADKDQRPAPRDKPKPTDQKPPIIYGRRTVDFHGLPWSPLTQDNRRKTSVFQGAADTVSSQIYPNGFKILKEKNEVAAYCAIRAIFDSLWAQLPLLFPDRMFNQGDISLNDLKLAWLDVVRSRHQEQPQLHFIQRLGKTLRLWAGSISDPMDLCLGCILVNGREWIDTNTDGQFWSNTIIWITTINLQGKTFYNDADDFRGLVPIRRKSSDPASSPSMQAPRTALGGTGRAFDRVGEDHGAPGGTGGGGVDDMQDGQNTNKDDNASRDYVQNVVSHILET